jgi:hypothetical protein
MPGDVAAAWRAPPKHAIDRSATGRVPQALFRRCDILLSYFAYGQNKNRAGCINIAKLRPRRDG